MANLMLLGFGIDIAAQTNCKLKIETLLEDIQECWITTFDSWRENPTLFIFSNLIGQPKVSTTPYIALVYKPRDIESGQIEKIIERLEVGGVKILIEFHPIPLAQTSPNLKELKELIAQKRI